MHKIKIGTRQRPAPLGALGIATNNASQKFPDLRAKRKVAPKLYGRVIVLRHRERVLMLLLMNDGKTYQEISEFGGCSYRSVAKECVHGEPDIAVLS